MIGIESKWLKWLLFVTFVIGLLVSVNVTSRRIAFEEKQKTVETIISYNDIHALGILIGEGPDALLKEIKTKSGIQSVAIEEETLGDFVNSGRATVLKGSDIQNLYHVGHVSNYILSYIYKNVRVDPDRYYIIVQEQADYERVRDFLTAEYGQERVKRISRSRNILEVLDTGENLMNVGVGLSANKVKKVQKMGYTVVARLKNSRQINSEVVIQKFLNLDQFPDIKTIIFDGEEVLGYPSQLSFAKRKLSAGKYQVGSVEFARQAGFSYFADQMTRSLVRVHSIPQEQMETIAVEKAVRRYLRASKERSIKALYLHPFLNRPGSSENLKELNLTYFKSVQDRIPHIGMVAGQVTGGAELDYQPIRSWESFLVSAAVVSVFLFFLSHYTMLGVFQTAVFMVIFGFSFYFMNLFGALDSWIRLMGVFTAILFPTYALISRFPTQAESEQIEQRFKATVRYLAEITIISLCGALFISALMTDPKYLLGTWLFFGVKISFIIPIILIGLYFYLRPHRLTSIVYIFKRLFFAPVRTSSLIAVLICAGFVLIYLLRSGNYLSFQIPFVEEYIRTALEEWLTIRPRTKEFLIGYPFLIATFFYIDRGISRNWLWFYNMIGSVALISIVNSFSHLHTPVMVSLYRTLFGLGIGVAVTLFYWMLLNIGRYILKRGS